MPAEWGSWSSWTECSVTCGLGQQYRVRVCGEDAEGIVDETNCEGEAEEMQSCHMSECPVSNHIARDLLLIGFKCYLAMEPFAFLQQ